MKRVLFGTFILSLLAFIDVKAGVTFLPQAIEAQEYTISDENSSKTLCQNEGFSHTATSCSGTVREQCPYNDKYFKYCDPATPGSGNS